MAPFTSPTFITASSFCSYRLRPGFPSVAESFFFHALAGLFWFQKKPIFCGFLWVDPHYVSFIYVKGSPPPSLGLSSSPPRTVFRAPSIFPPVKRPSHSFWTIVPFAANFPFDNFNCKTELLTQFSPSPSSEAGSPFHSSVYYLFTPVISQ